MCLIPLKPQFYTFLSGKSLPKLALGKISRVNFCKVAQIKEKVDNFSQGVPPFDIKFK